MRIKGKFKNKTQLIQINVLNLIVRDDDDFKYARQKQK